MGIKICHALVHRIEFAFPARAVHGIFDQLAGWIFYPN